MANNKVNLGCNQLKGTFQLYGKVNGRLSQNFYNEGVGRNGKEWRKVRFGVEIDQGQTVYIELYGAAQDNCYISKRTTLPGGKINNETVAIPWSERFNFTKNPAYKGFTVIGVTCGCEKIIDAKGIEKNNVKRLTQFDACDEVQNLHDGDSVFVRGNIQYSTYNGQHKINFEPTQISLCRPIDFDDMAFQPSAKFTQPFVLMDVISNKETEEYEVQAKIVNYSTIEDTEFYIKKEYAKLAKTLKKQGSYVHVEAIGNIVVEGKQQREEISDEWGLQTNVMDRISSPVKRKLVIEGVDPSSVDKTTYSRDVIEHAMDVIASIQSAKNDYGKDDDEDWRTKSGSNLDDGDDFDMDLGI